MTDIDEKRAHVRRATLNRPHTCHWRGCTEQVPPAMWGCRVHWFQLPKRIRDAIWAAYKPGQEERMDPSEAYLAAAKLADEWIEGHQRRMNAAVTEGPSGYIRELIRTEGKK